jgi:hypothetical protein
MPFSAINGFDLFNKLRVIWKGNCYSVWAILADCYYPITDTSIGEMRISIAIIA